jgi:hypothetical protein
MGILITRVDNKQDPKVFFVCGHLFKRIDDNLEFGKMMSALKKEIGSCIASGDIAMQNHYELCFQRNQNLWNKFNDNQTD